MNTIIILAQILGTIFMVLGLSMLINRKTVPAIVDAASQDQGFLWLLGFVALAMGAVIVALNNSWSSGLRSLISVIGWLTLLKGTVILLFPDSTISLYKKHNKSGVFMAGGFIVFVLGIVLLYKGLM